MTRFRSRRTRRARKRYMWTGIQSSFFLPANPTGLSYSVVEIVKPGTLGPGVAAAEAVVERTIIEFNVQNEGGEPPEHLMGMYLTTGPTNLLENPTIEQLWPPLATDLDATQKRPMWWRQFLLDPGVSGTGTIAAWNAGNPFDIPVKRKLKGDMALLLVVQTDATASNVIGCNVLIRTLLSLGRR